MQTKHPIPDRVSLSEWIQSGEDWLLARILKYAKRQDYTRFTSTLEQAWRSSIIELSKAIVLALASPTTIVEFSPDDSFEHDPISEFAVQEAKRHRERGISLTLFLGMFKYFRQSYLDWLNECDRKVTDAAEGAFLITRIFDRLEIAFCSKWAEMSGLQRLAELQESNRRLTNEKNRFLTVAESLGTPVILLDAKNRISYANGIAAGLFGLPAAPGRLYYQHEPVAFPDNSWLLNLLRSMLDSPTPQLREYVHHGESGEQVYEVLLHPMLDVSDKYQGTVVILHDITRLRRTEQELADKAQQLERISITDPLTGLLNRRGLFTMAEKHVAMATRTGRPLLMFYVDLNGLKKINDRYGHSVGDSALIAMSDALKASVRVSDTVARIGGDEFVILLPDQEDLEDRSVLTRIETNLTVLARSSLEQEIELTFSSGRAIYRPESHRSFEQLLLEADEAMYSEKREHRSNGV